MYTKQIIVAIVVALAIVGGFSAVTLHANKSSNDMKSKSTSVASTNHVDIKDYMFSPMTIKVKVGTTVIWTNQDAVKHTITADMKSSNAPDSMDIGQGQSYSFKFTHAGTYTYHCFPHPFMHGTIIVTE